MPVAAAELPIGEGMQPGSLLLFDQSGNFLVFHLLQIQSGDLPLANCSRAFFSRAGRKKLPTISKRNGARNVICISSNKNDLGCC